MTDNSNPYDEDYYLRGPQTGKSNYVDYHWMEERTIAMAKSLIGHLGIEKGARVLDFGCGRGYTVKALRMLGVNAVGYDISQWAIQNCDPDVVGHVFTAIAGGEFDHVFAKDVFEHIPVEPLSGIVDMLLSRTRKNLLAVVPLSDWANSPYVRKEDNQDATHIIRWPLEDWLEFFQHRSLDDTFAFSGSWHMPGLKPTSLSALHSCGFLRADRFPST